MADVIRPVALAEAKLHLRINPGDDSEDALVGALIEAAREYCGNVLGKAPVGFQDVETPFAIRQAMLLLIGHWYANREAVVTENVVPREVQLTVDVLLNQYRGWWF